MNATCSICGHGALEALTITETFTHARQPLQVEGIEISRCSNCGEEIVNAKQYRANQARVTDAKRAKDGLLQSHEIRAIRDRHGLTQVEASTLLGGGVNAFSKYERGEVMQSGAMDTLLRVIDNVPAALDFLRSSTKQQWRDAGTQTLGESNVIPLERYREKKILVNFPQATENEQSYAYHG